MGISQFASRIPIRKQQTAPNVWCRIDMASISETLIAYYEMLAHEVIVSLPTEIDLPWLFYRRVKAIASVPGAVLSEKIMHMAVYYATKYYSLVPPTINPNDIVPPHDLIVVCVHLARVNLFDYTENIGTWEDLLCDEFAETERHVLSVLDYRLHVEFDKVMRLYHFHYGSPSS